MTKGPRNAGAFLCTFTHTPLSYEFVKPRFCAGSMWKKRNILPAPGYQNIIKSPIFKSCLTETAASLKKFSS